MGDIYCFKMDKILDEIILIPNIKRIIIFTSGILFSNVVVFYLTKKIYKELKNKKKKSNSPIEESKIIEIEKCDMTKIEKGWFYEKEVMWPGQKMGLKVEKVL